MSLGFKKYLFLARRAQSEVQDSRDGADRGSFRGRVSERAASGRIYAGRRAVSQPRTRARLRAGGPGEGLPGGAGPKPSGAARARRAARPGGRWRCGGGGRGRRARRRGPRVRRRAGGSCLRDDCRQRCDLRRPRRGPPGRRLSPRSPPLPAGASGMGPNRRGPRTLRCP